MRKLKQPYAIIYAGYDSHYSIDPIDVHVRAGNPHQTIYVFFCIGIKVYYTNAPYDEYNRCDRIKGTEYNFPNKESQS